MFTPSVGGPVLVSPTRPGIGDSARAQRGSWHAVAYWPDEVVAHTSPMIVWVVARAVDALTWCVWPGSSAVVSWWESSPPASPRA